MRHCLHHLNVTCLKRAHNFFGPLYQIWIRFGAIAKEDNSKSNTFIYFFIFIFLSLLGLMTFLPITKSKRVFSLAAPYSWMPHFLSPSMSNTFLGFDCFSIYSLLGITLAYFIVNLGSFIIIEYIIFGNKFL